MRIVSSEVEQLAKSRFLAVFRWHHNVVERTHGRGDLFESTTTATITNGSVVAHVKRDYCRELASKRLISTLMTDNQQHGLTARDEHSRMDAGHDFQSWD